MKKPHVISKEDFVGNSDDIVLASSFPNKRLFARIDLFADRLYYTLEFLMANGDGAQTNYLTFDDAIEAYNNV